MHNIDNFETIDFTDAINLGIIVAITNFRNCYHNRKLKQVGTYKIFQTPLYYFLLPSGSSPKLSGVSDSPASTSAFA
jgi:hypothetical protein